MMKAEKELTEREKEIKDDLQWMLDNPDKLVWHDGDKVLEKLGINV